MNLASLLAGCAFLLVMALPAQWSWTPLENMPFATANHAICGATVNGQQYVYLFGGITTGLTNSDIHRACARYDVATSQWTTLPDLPDTLGKIASAASVVGSTAYVMGGYHVYSGPPYELSSNRVHRLDLVTDTWLPDGAPIPVPIDDHVQAVWRDSLVYLITGWSNTTNVANVQIYDAALDSWTSGTPVPNNSQYKAFGASGVIIGDTIYYYGGASTGFNFPAQDKLRIGAIDPSSPSEITWLPATSVPAGPRYRSASINVNGSPCWVGGSAVSYNYDAIAYNGSGVVEPVTSTPLLLDGMWTDAGDAPHHIMDLRGVGIIDAQRFIIAGGIGPDRTVLDSAFLVTHSHSDIHEPFVHMLHGYPNPASDTFRLTLPAELLPCRIELLDMSGRQLIVSTPDQRDLQLSVVGMPEGNYMVKIVGTNAIGRARLSVMHP